MRGSLPLSLSAERDSSPLPLSIRIFLWQLLRDRLPSGVEVSKRNGPGNGLCPLCGFPESCTHIMFMCPAAQFLWNFVREALGPAWRVQDLGEFLETKANRTGRGRHLFWLVFAAITWSLWKIRNKMVIERIFPWARGRHLAGDQGVGATLRGSC
uniref:Uncharacterized protein n=1 Tax=Avena sativa TaxID=4498 RepID=A0ACD5XXA3_AVESA